MFAKSPARSADEENKEDGGGGGGRGGTAKRERAKMRVWHHLRTAGSAIIPRPFEFSSFVITTNTRQMKRAKSERKGERKKNGGEER